MTVSWIALLLFTVIVGANAYWNYRRTNLARKMFGSEVSTFIAFNSVVSSVMLVISSLLLFVMNLYAW